MTAQEIANEMLAEHQSARMKLAITRSEAFVQFLRQREVRKEVLTCPNRQSSDA